jgi:flagellar basal-body rod modification protein FlgD
MSVSPIGNVSNLTSSAKTNSTTSRTNNSTLGKDDFLKILVTQLQHQDPSQPLDDKAFIAQMAQFTSVEQLTNMNTEMTALRQSLSFSPSYIGKQISWTAVDSTGASTVKSGVIDGLTFKSGNQFASVNGEEVSLDQILKVTNPG